MAEAKKTTEKKTEKATTKPVVKAEKKVAEKKVEKKPVAKKDDKKVVNEVKASARFVRISPRKVRLVLDQVRGLDAAEAVKGLQFMHKAAVSPVSKLLNSAIANAENNFQIDKKDLFIKKLVADDGPTLKRQRPRAFGRSTMIRKRTSHINLILGVKDGAKKMATNKKVEKAEEIKVVNPDDVKQDASKNIDKSSGSGEGKSEKGFTKGIFNRKVG